MKYKDLRKSLKRLKTIIKDLEEVAKATGKLLWSITWALGKLLILIKAIQKIVQVFLG